MIRVPNFSTGLATTSLTPSDNAGVPGKSEAVCPSTPMPRRIKWRRGYAASAADRRPHVGFVLRGDDGRVGMLGSDAMHRLRADRHFGEHASYAIR